MRRKVARRERTTTIPNGSIFMFCWNSRLRSSVTNVAKSAGKFSSSNIRICRNSFVSRVEHSYGEFALYRWKLVQKLINALPDYR
jgi:hypothetical protein